MFCTKCGKKLNKDAKFCPDCGEKVEIEKVKDEDVEVVAAAAVQPQVEDDDFVRPALTSFIISTVNAATFFIPILGLVFAIINAGIVKKGIKCEKQPFKIFAKIALPLNILELVLSILATLMLLIFLALIIAGIVTVKNY